MAFQPIVDVRDRSVFAYESLVRGKDGSGAGSVLGQVTESNRYTFDQACRTTSVEMAAKLGITCFLSINFLPNAVYEPAACIRATVAAAKLHDFPVDKLIFEFSECEAPRDLRHVKRVVDEYRRLGFRTALDDFGAGYAGLTSLVHFQTDIIKLDMQLVRNIHLDVVRQSIVRNVLALCDSLNIQVVAEGVEQVGEMTFLQSLGIYLFQGYLFARPGFEMLPIVRWPTDATEPAQPMLG